jgi:K+-transporting ATPase A subunit
MIQSISLLGIVLSAVSQFGLMIAEKTVENFWAIYPSWIVIFIIGTIIRVMRKDTIAHHHHHHDDHDHEEAF